MSIIQMLLGISSGFTPGNATYTSSGTFTVPTGTTTLKIEIWGGGGSGGASVFGGTNPASTNNTSGGQSSVSVLSMTANGGTKGQNIQPSYGGAGGTAAGGTTNTTGTAGAAGQTYGSCGSPNFYFKGGSGGASPNGGAGGTATCSFNGANGTSPGGGGAGTTGQDNDPEAPEVYGGGGGGGGGYSTKTLTSSIAGSYVYVVGAGGSKGTGVVNGGDGAVGAVKFTWS
jgi:hypothetical protein